MKIEYEIIERSDIDDSIRVLVVDMLKKQGEVQGRFNEKADRCNYICVASINGTAVGMGAIKRKTTSDFEENKADLPSLSGDFQWELGYIFTDPEHTGNGIASNVVDLLLAQCLNHHLMASTKLADNPPMVRILEKRGFRLFGKPWKSDIHGQHLGLFLRFATQEQRSEPKTG